MKLIILKVIFIKFIYAFIITFSFASYASNNDEEKYKYLDLFGQVFDRVRSSYVEKVSDQELIEKAIDGMLSGLDPHSGYMKCKWTLKVNLVDLELKLQWKRDSSK